MQSELREKTKKSGGKDSESKESSIPVCKPIFVSELSVRRCRLTPA